MFSTDHLGLETHGSIGGSVRIRGRYTFTLGISTDSDDGMVAWKGTGDGSESE
jgi:hypothetical protein